MGHGGVYVSQNLSLYSYVGNNPVVYFDPTGLTWYYYQATGNIAEWVGGKRLHYFEGNTNPRSNNGYLQFSGRGNGINNPARQYKKNGPVPSGFYHIGKKENHLLRNEQGHHYKNKNGKWAELKNAMMLHPFTKQQMQNRSDVWMHGQASNDPLNSSEGCIVASPNVRKVINKSNDRVLRVVK